MKCVFRSDLCSFVKCIEPI